MESLRERLLGPSPASLSRSGRLAWLGILLVTVLGGAVRLWRLDHPHRLVFDETYYVKQAWSLRLHGHEREIREGLEKPDELFTDGTPDVFGDVPDLVVHPPVGKWMIALGQIAFGPESSFGWRVSSAVVGTLSILVLGGVAWLLWRNALLAISAATLLAVDGHHFVQSRTGLLDIFVMWWALLAFLLLLLDREQGRRRLAARWGPWQERQRGRPVPRTPWGRWSRWWGPSLGPRWWRLAAGVSLGLCVGTKWSGLFFLAVFGLMTVWWDVGARRTAGAPGWFTGAVVRDGIPAFLTVVPTALVTYVASWAGWFATDGGWKRQWAVDNPAAPGSLAGLVPDPLRSLWAYHAEMMNFHVGLQNEHKWSSNPWSWTVQWRPTLFYAQWPERGEQGCEADRCVDYIASLGNVFVWWGATAGMLVVLFLWLLGRDWRAGAALSGIVAGWLPWFLYQTRTVYSFYAVAFVPWLVLVVVCCLALALGPATASPARRRWGAVAVVVYVTLATVWFVWYYPVHAAVVIPREEWRMRLWFDFWN
ncbi:dolichyl-phosphate-mannose--protein mannosyltransferase [Ornithinimicrobium cerasi]|uniref:dolichyl-phosphate-mannose--protein mannosyltransferase n=1 Tax=Ornithinimicrobium cerasi TaxID=2248773 RepID=UPI000EFDDE77|nr:phospholipid carrier-dependent glycosyltransferase [Ornithinimicrobium cerasi]